jgi:hypothetical protein
VIIKNKIGSHVGMMLSFMIFVTFVIFVFAVLRPTMKVGEGRQVILDDTEHKIIQNVSENFTMVGVSLKTSYPDETCVYLQNILPILSINPPYRIIVKSEEGNTQNAALYNPIDVNGVLTADAIAINRDEDRGAFFRIYSSPRFDRLLANPGSCVRVKYDEIDKNYQIGGIFSGKYVFESMIRNLVNEYERNYTLLKRDLKISPSNEFSFYVLLSNGSRIEANQTTRAKNIYAQETPIQYVDADANVQAGYIITKIW